MLVNCKNCGKEFNKLPSQIKKTKNHFCNRSCSATFNNKGKQKNPPKERICKNCKNIYFYKRKTNTLSFCKNCLDECGIDLSKGNFHNLKTEQIKNLTLKDYREKLSVKGKHKSWLNVHVRMNNRSWNRQLLKSNCQKCNYSKHVELCHIKPITSFHEETKIKEINDPNNILVLCRNCHWEFDNDFLDLQDIPNR